MRRVIFFIVFITLYGCSYKSPVGKIYSLNYNGVPDAYYFKFDSTQFKVMWRHRDGPCYIGNWKKEKWRNVVKLLVKEPPPIIYNVNYGNSNKSDTSWISFRNLLDSQNGSIDISKDSNVVFYVGTDGFFKIPKVLLKDSFRIAPYHFTFNDFPKKVPLLKRDTIEITYQFDGKCTDKSILPVWRLNLGKPYIKEVDSIPVW